MSTCWAIFFYTRIRELGFSNQPQASGIPLWVLGFINKPTFFFQSYWITSGKKLEFSVLGLVWCESTMISFSLNL